MKKSFEEFIKKHGRSESGFTMAEILVAIALLAVLTAVVTSTIINATQTSEKFSRGTMNEGQLLNAVSLITRDISLAKEVQYASDTALAVDTLEGGNVSNVFYFYWTGNATSIPSAEAFTEVRNNAQRLSTQPGIVEYRVVNGNVSDPTVRTIIEGYNPGGNTGNQLFTYYDGGNSEILLDATNPPQVADAKLPEIRRVEIHFTSYIDSRDNAMELHTSASPRFLGSAGASVSGVENMNGLDTPATPLLYGDLVPRTNTAKLEWTPIAGATGYTVYRTNRNQTPLTEVAGSTANSTFDDPNLAWGETYEYFVVAQGWAGDSNPTQKIRLRVTPQPTQFINIVPTRGQAGESISGYTVARNLNNQLTWQVSPGENIKYRLYTVSSTGVKTLVTDTNLTIYTHTNRAYGAVTNYVVVAYNDPIPGYSRSNPSSTTGGTAADSPPVSLVSPPIAPVLSGDARNDLTATTAATATNVLTITNTIPTATGYRFTHGSTSAGAGGTQGQTGASKTWSHLPGWGTTTYYSATAYNDAGSSPVSTPPVKLDQHPGPFTISDVTNNTGYGNVVVQGTETGAISTVKSQGTMEVSWGASSGSTNFNVYRDLRSSFGTATMSGSIMDWLSDQGGLASTARSTSFGNAHPGIVYDVTVQSVAANGLSRNVASTLLTRPDVPRRGISEGICLANNTATYGMYVDANTTAKNGYASHTTISFAKEGAGAAAPVTYSVGTSVSAFQNLNYQQWGNITYQNTISRGNVPDSVAAHGTTDSERVSYPLTLEMEILGHFSGCTSAGRAIPTSIAPSQQSSTWVVPYDVCYGYIPGHFYGQYYMDPNNRTAKGYVYQDYADGFQDWMVQKGSGGCIWRLHPKTGREPYWDSVG